MEKELSERFSAVGIARGVGAAVLIFAALALLLAPRDVLGMLPEALRGVIGDYRLAVIALLLTASHAAAAGPSVKTLGAGFGAGGAMAAFWVWSNYTWLWNRAWLPNPLNKHPLVETFGVDTLRMIRTVANEQGLVIMLVAAMLGATLLDWLWRMSFGRLDQDDDGR